MAFRRWLARSLVAVLLALLGGGYYLYQRWTDPETVRAAVLGELATRLPNAEIELDSARLRLLGGIQLQGLKIRHRQDPAGPALLTAAAIVLIHDKEQLSHGKLAIRKIELKRPRLHLIRHADGVWNLAGILPPIGPGDPLPHIECQDGTLVLVDEKSAGEAVEIHEVNLTLTPAGVRMLNFRAAGVCPLLGDGRIEVHGDANLKTGEMAFQIGLSSIALGPALLRLGDRLGDRLADYAPEVKQHAQGVEGFVDLSGEITYHPESVRPWNHTLAIHLRQGRLSHPLLPVPLEQAEAVLRCDGDKVTLQRLDARVAGAALHVRGELAGPSPDADFDMHVRIDQLAVERDLYPRLPEFLRKLCSEFQPEGVISLESDLHRREGALRSRHQVRTHGMAILYEQFPYRAEKLMGTLDYVDDGRETPVLKIDLQGVAGRRPVRIKGRVFGEGLRPDDQRKTGVELDLSGERLPIDERAFAALRPYPDTLKLVQRFEPAGELSFLAELKRDPEAVLTPGHAAPELDIHLLLRAHGVSFRYDQFPYRVEHVEGNIEIMPDGGWRFFECQGRRKGGEFRGFGSGRVTAKGTQIALTIHGTNALLDQEMAAALSGDIKNAWLMLRPGGRIDFAARVDQLGEAKPELELDLTARACTLRPTVFPYSLAGVRGSLNYARKRVKLGRFEARHGNTLIQLERGEVLMLPDGGAWTHLRQLWAEPLGIDDDFLQAAPGKVRTVFETLRPDKPVRLITDLTVEKPGDSKKPAKYGWDGHLMLADSKVHCGVPLHGVTGLVACWGTHDGKELRASGNIHLDQAVLFKQPLRDVRSHLEIDDDSVHLSGLRAGLHGGEVYGPIRFDFGSEVQYAVNVTASQVDLERLARATLERGSQMRGTASAQLNLTGRGSDRRTLRGNGSIDIEDARLYDVPLIVEILTFLSGKVPSGTAFQEAHAQFTVDGEQMNIGRLDLLGDSLTLRGQGRMKIDATDLSLEMHGLPWGRTLALLPRVLDQIPPAISKQLMKIRVEGDLGKTRITTEPVPIVTEPLKGLLEVMSRRNRPDSSMPRR